MGRLAGLAGSVAGCARYKIYRDNYAGRELIACINLRPHGQTNPRQTGPPRCRGMFRGIASPAVLCHK